MACNDYFSEFTESELRVHLKTLQKALLQGTRQIMFKDQQITWSTASELKERIQLVKESLACKNPSGNSGGPSKKVVRIQTKSKGF